MAASDRARLHALTAPATGKIATAPIGGNSEIGVLAHATTVLIVHPTHKMPARACGWKTASVGREMFTRPIRWRGGASGFL
jgi:hypothetical protein